MIYEDKVRGKAKIANYIPTVPALRYCNCCTLAGWHHCNELYHQEYADSGEYVFLIFTVDGVGRIEAGERMHVLKKDSLILVPPHTPMKYSTDRETGLWEFFWLDLTGEQLFSTAEKLWQDERHYIRSLPAAKNFFEDLLDESLSEPRRSELIGRLFDAVIAEAVFESNTKKSTADNIILYISEHYREHIDLDELSGRFYLSQNQIIRIMKTRTGYTPHEYLVRFRLARACELLQNTSDSIGEIGRAVGYENGSHFSAVFRSFYGISPGEYRLRFSR